MPYQHATTLPPLRSTSILSTTCPSQQPFSRLQLAYSRPRLCDTHATVSLAWYAGPFLQRVKPGMGFLAWTFLPAAPRPVLTSAGPPRHDAHPPHAAPPRRSETGFKGLLEETLTLLAPRLAVL
jgi:hypothetical protein